MKTKFLFISILLFIIIGVPTVWAQSVDSSTVNAEAKTVKAIEVTGNKTISMATILSRIKTRVGQPYLQNVISDDLKRLYNTGYFSDVRVDRQEMDGGFKVVIILDEKPIVEELTFSKLKHFKPKALRKKLKTQENQFLDNKHLKDDEQTIKELYEQKGLTLVDVEVEQFVDETSNKVSLHFIIREGQRVRVKKISILGNSSYTDKKIFRLIKSRAKGLFNSGLLKEDVLKEDMERIASFYEQEGYIDVMVDYNIDYTQKENIEVIVEIDEGKRYSVGSLDINGNDIISDKEVMKVMANTEVGNVFSREKLTLDLSQVRSLYFDRGYIFADVRESTSIDAQTGKVDVSLNIMEGGLAYIEEVKIQGNTRTRDTVIRRELRMYPGDRFDGQKLRRSKERLNNLGYFEEINFDIEDTDVSDRKDLLVQVKEAKTGAFSFGGGFSTVDKVVGFVEIEQRNFDITNWPTFTGGGQDLQLRAETGSSKNNLYLSFTEPWLFDYPISAGFDAYRTVREREEDTGYAYDEERLGGDIRLGKQFTEFVSGNVMYKNEEIVIENILDSVSSDLKAEEGTNRVSMLGFSLKRDSRDNVFSPTKGFYVSGATDVAGGYLGGTKDFYRLQAKGSYYIPFKFKSVFEFSLHAGIIDAYGDSDKVPIFERFFAGGASSIRGYNERKVGPLDSSTDDPVGGESMLVGSVEYTVPLIEFVKVATFYDIGNVWSDVSDIGFDGLKSGVGVGLRVKTPIGPVNLDYGYPLNDEPGEEDRSGKFYFSISRGF